MWQLSILIGIPFRIDRFTHIQHEFRFWKNKTEAWKRYKRKGLFMIKLDIVYPQKLTKVT